MHPKTEIMASPASLRKILDAGWVGQVKIHGHRAQIHLSADPSDETIVYNRQGRPHKKLLPDEMIAELRRVFDLKEKWTVLDAEWIKPENKLYIFDILKKDGELLRRLTYPERYKLLPREYLSPYIQTLPLITTLEKCQKVLSDADEKVEGLVFKSTTSPGFSDSSIIRCRKREARIKT